MVVGFWFIRLNVDYWLREELGVKRGWISDSLLIYILLDELVVLF